MPFRFTIAGLMGLTAIIAVILAMATHDTRKRIIEELKSPVQVTGHTPAGLQLADGRLVLPAGLQSLPAQSRALDHAIARGVEVLPNGRIYALVRLNRWCGNDPVVDEIRRVDLALYLEFLSEAKPTTAATMSFPVPTVNGGDFWGKGWDLSEYWLFCQWCAAQKGVDVPNRKTE